MVRASRKRVKNPEKVYSFRKELAELYQRFRSDVEAFSKKHKVKINYWYSPSTISQPKFIIDDVGFTADELCNEKELTILASRTNKRNVKRIKKRNVI